MRRPLLRGTFVILAAAVSGSGLGAAPRQGATCARSLPAHARAVRSAGVLHADVTGDRREERVSITENPQAKHCRFFLSVTGSNRTYATSLRQSGIDSTWPTRDAPRLLLAAPIDSVPGRDLVVVVDAEGTSTSLAIFAVHQGRLSRFRIPKAASTTNTFAYGGSLAASYTVNCIGARKRGVVVESSLANRPNGKTFDVTRTIFRSRNFVFRFTGYQTFRDLTESEVRARFPELRRGMTIFSSCR